MESERTEAQMRADVAEIRDQLAEIAGRPRRMARWALIAAGLVVVGFLLLAVVGQIVGSPDYQKIYDAAYSRCLASSGAAATDDQRANCRALASQEELDARLRDRPELRQSLRR